MGWEGISKLAAVTDGHYQARGRVRMRNHAPPNAPRPLARPPMLTWFNEVKLHYECTARVLWPGRSGHVVTCVDDVR